MRARDKDAEAADAGPYKRLRGPAHASCSLPVVWGMFLSVMMGIDGVYMAQGNSMPAVEVAGMLVNLSLTCKALLHAVRRRRALARDAGHPVWGRVEAVLLLRRRMASPLWRALRKLEHGPGPACVSDASTSAQLLPKAYQPEDLEERDCEDARLFVLGGGDVTDGGWRFDAHFTRLKEIQRWMTPPGHVFVGCVCPTCLTRQVRTWEFCDFGMLDCLAGTDITRISYRAPSPEFVLPTCAVACNGRLEPAHRPCTHVRVRSVLAFQGTGFDGPASVPMHALAPLHRVAFDGFHVHFPPMLERRSLRQHPVLWCVHCQQPRVCIRGPTHQQPKQWDDPHADGWLFAPTTEQCRRMIRAFRSPLMTMDRSSDLRARFRALLARINADLQRGFTACCPGDHAHEPCRPCDALGNDGLYPSSLRVFSADARGQ